MTFVQQYAESIIGSKVGAINQSKIIDVSHELSMSMFSPHKTNLAPYKSIQRE